MLLAGKDAALVSTSQQAALNTYQLHSKSTNLSEIQTYSTVSVPAIKILNNRGEFSMSIGVLPPWWRPIIKKIIPWYRNGAGAVKNLAGIAVNAVAARLAADRETGGLGYSSVDLLVKLKAAKDEDGNPMGREELTAECQTQVRRHPLFEWRSSHLCFVQLIAGS
jgi:benzoate 4-monooxygenase